MSARTDTITALPVSRPEPPTVEFLLPLRPPITATYRVTRWWHRKPSPHLGLAVGSGLATCVIAAHVIVSALAGAM